MKLRKKLPKKYYLLTKTKGKFGLLQAFLGGGNENSRVTLKNPGNIKEIYSYYQVRLKH
jgi:hypothetical protein